MHAFKGMNPSPTNQNTPESHSDNTTSQSSNTHATPPPAISESAPEQQQQHPLNELELREKIVEILSNTANGCLMELGYYPGITQKMKQLEVTNTTWQTENVKLYDDNRRLLETVRGLQEQLRLVSIPEKQKLDRIRQLEVEIQSLRDATARQHPQERLQKEFNRLKDSYTRAFNEVNRLTALLQAQSTIGPPPHSAPVQSSYQQPHGASLQQPNFPGFQTPQRPMQLPSGAWHGGQPHQLITATLQMHPLQQTQLASLKQRQFQGTTVSNAQLRRPSTVASVPMRQQSLPQNVHGQMMNPPLHIDQLQHTPETVPFGFHSRVSGPTDPLALMASSIQRERSTSNPNTPTSSSCFTSQPMLHPMPTKFPTSARPSPAPRTGSAPMAFDSMSTKIDTSPMMISSFHEQGSSGPPNIPPAHPPPFNPLPHVPGELNPPQMAPTVIANNIQMQPPHPVPYEGFQGTPRYESHVERANTELKITTVSPQDLHIQPSIARKRSYSSDRGPWEEGSDKRARYGSPHVEVVHGVATPQPTPTSGQTVFAPVPSETLDTSMLDFSTEISQAYLQSGVESSGLDAEGLRSLHDCIEEVFEYGSDGVRVCRLCLHRYQQNYMSDPPSSFVNTPDEVLEAHCLAEHEQAWLMLRQVED